MTDIPLSFLKSSTMPQATNLISIDDSMQAEELASACLVAIIGTTNILLIVLDRTIQGGGGGGGRQEIFVIDETYSMKTMHSSFIESRIWISFP